MTIQSQANQLLALKKNYKKKLLKKQNKLLLKVPMIKHLIFIQRFLKITTTIKKIHPLFQPPKFKRTDFKNQ